MKRKLFSLAPLVCRSCQSSAVAIITDAIQKIPSSKSDNKALKDALAAKPLSPPVSPFTDRRVLEPDVEARLRVVCAAIVANYKPSDHVFETDTTDFEAFQLAAGEKRSYPHHYTNHPALAAPPSQSRRRLHEIQQLAAEQLAGPHPSKYSYRPDAALHDLLPGADSTHPTVQANISRQRDGLNMQGGPADLNPPVRASSANPRPASGQYLRAHSLDSRPRTAPAHDSMDGSYSTPLSASTTDYQYNYASTALTSVAITPSRASKRASQQNMAVDQTAVSLADAAAAEWMREELERRRFQAYEMDRGRTRQPPPSRASNSRMESRASSRGRSIRAGITEYFRPSSRQSLSRSSSRGSMRPASRASRASEDGSERPSSSHGWRSWGFQRKDSSRSNSRPGSSRGRSETRGRDDSKKELNLNRELPPLPSLDQYKEEKPSTGGTHIAALMRPKTRGRNSKQTSEKREVLQRSVTAEQKKPVTRVDSGDPGDPLSTRARAKSSGHSQSSSRDYPLPMTPSVPSATNTDPALSIVDLAPSVEGARRRHRGHVRQKSSGDTVNFSRKRSVDERGLPLDGPCPNMLEVTALPHAPTSQKDVSGLKKIFSGLRGAGRREKKQMTWMERIEAEGVKGGIMVEAAGAPTVRY